jgi:Tfp pilus assembly protein PilF
MCPSLSIESQAGRRNPAKRASCVQDNGSKLRALQTLRAALIILALGLGWAARAQVNAAPATNGILKTASAGFAGSSSCRQCHEHFYQLWSTSFHGLAMQPYTPELARTKLTPQKAEIAAGKYHFRADLEKGEVTERSPEGDHRYPMVQAMGGKNVFYFLTPLERGWLQVLPVAYDVRRKEWYDTTASAMRHFGDRRDEALYWKERPLTFNTSCFGCHVSQLTKNYDLGADTYRTTWAEPGINCETCHGPSAGHVQLFQKLPTNAPAPADIKLIVLTKLSTDRRNDTCAPCHAKMSPLTMNFTPGDRYFDHFDLVGFEHADFYPDGRDLGENYTYTQWRLSPCAKSGQLDCVHCHTSSGRYRFSEAAKANDACLPCHAERVANAPAHTHHEAGTAGNECISCHMPMTEFARMRRTDHSMRPPTPATTIAYKSPNACNLCHTNKDAAWSDKYVREWRKRDYQKPVLERAALLAAARKQDWKKLPDILAYFSRPDHEEVQTVSLVRLLADCTAEDKWPALRNLLNDPSPWVRASVAEALGLQLDQPNIATLIKAAGDDYRLVRVRAATALAGIPDESLPEAQRRQVQSAMTEMFESMRSRPDDMASHYNLGNLYIARHQMQDAAAEFETAIRLQPEGLPPYVNVALAYNALGQNDKAEASLRQALRLVPTNSPVNLNLGMLLAEVGKMSEAEQAFRAAFRSDTNSAQAAYNLGILLSKDHPEEALIWCRRAADLRPDNPQYGYTYAFYLYRAGQLDQALQTLRKVRERHPDHPDSTQLERQILLEQQQKRSGGTSR